MANASSSDEDDVEASNAESDLREHDRLRNLANTSSLWQRRRDSYVASVEMIRSLTTYVPRNGGSVMGRRYTRRLRKEAHDKLMEEYFNPDCIHCDDTFRRRFRMRRPLFLRILNAVAAEDFYFRDKTTITGRLSLSGLQKVVCVFLQLSQGI